MRSTNFLPKTTSTQAFTWHFPLLSRIFGNFPVIAILLFLCSAGLSFIDIHVGLGALAILLGCFGLWLDRRHLNSWLVLPLTWFASVPILSGGVGIILLYASGQEIPSEFVLLQSAYLVGFSMFFLGYAMARNPKRSLASFRTLTVANGSMRHALVYGGMLCLLWAVGCTITGVISGVTDRGDAGEEAYLRVFGYWSYFLAFEKVGFAGLILAPLIFFRTGLTGKVFTIACVSIIFGFALLSGSRQAALIPVIAIIVGFYGFSRTASFRLEWVLGAFLPLAIVAFVFIDHYRNTETYRREALSNPLEKAKAIGEAIIREKQAQDQPQGQALYLLADRFIGTLDPEIFAATPRSIPFAGTQNFSAVLWLYVPYYFYRDRPMLLDDKEIAETYKGRELIRTFIAPTLVGDLYRRFGWIGILLGMLSIGLFFGKFIDLVCVGLCGRSALPFIAIFLILTSMAFKDSSLTILTGVWRLFYDLPKQAFLLYLFLVLGRWAGSSIEKKVSIN